MANHMVPKDQVTLKFKCPSCGFLRREIYYVHRDKGDIASCHKYSCRNCGGIHRVPMEHDCCERCTQRIDCLVIPEVRFYEDVKLRREKIPIWTERMQKLQEKGSVRAAMEGNIHKALRTFRDDKSTSKLLRGSSYTMWEVMLMLTYGYIEQVGPLGKRGSYYIITEVGREALHQLNISGKRKGQLVELPVNIQGKWVEYFKSHQW
jgi:hypothetical protein